MTILVGCPPKRAAKAPLGLAALLARSAGEDLLVASVVPVPSLPGRSGEDRRYQGYIDALAERALARAGADLPADLTAEFVASRARSAAGGLLATADEQRASMIVVGSSQAGLFGRIALSSVADRLLHSSPVPVALAGRGFRCGGADRITRLTVAYDGTEHGDRVLAAGRELVGKLGATLRLVAFAVQPPPPETAMFNAEADDVLRTWSASVEQAARRAAPGESCAVAIGRGHTWSDALDDVEWAAGEVLVVGSSAAGPVARVFLGSRAAKIIRHAPVPVLVLPRAAV